MKTMLVNGTVIDCTGGPAMDHASLIIEDNKITKVSKAVSGEMIKEREDRVLDLDGSYIIPGLCNSHAHLGELFPDVKHTHDKETIIDAAIRAGRDAMNALQSGVTSMRVVGQQAGIDIAWRDAFNAGIFVGPRLFVCGEAIIATGGHGHGLPGIVEVDGPYEMRKAVREQLARGVDQIKIMVSGGHAEVIFQGEELEGALSQSQLFRDEIENAVQAAHQKGKKVCVHAGGEAMKLAIRCGIDCIEHGYFMDDEAINLMAENDVIYDPTLSINTDEQFMNAHGGLDKFEEGRVVKILSEQVTPEYAQIHKNGVQKAYEAGVKILTGTDAVPSDMFSLLWEMENLVWAGMSEMDVLIAATRNGAEACGVGDKLGTIEEGKLADLVVLNANPLKDISNLKQVKYVFKNGNLVSTDTLEGLQSFWELYFAIDS